MFVSNERKIIEYILRGYSNRYINLLLNIKADEIEYKREQIKRTEGGHVFA